MNWRFLSPALGEIEGIGVSVHNLAEAGIFVRVVPYMNVKMQDYAH
jgi:hypothetical protein